MYIDLTQADSSFLKAAGLQIAVQNTASVQLPVESLGDS